MNVEIGAEAAQFPEKEYIKGIAVVVYAEVQRSSSIFFVCNTVQIIWPIFTVCNQHLAATPYISKEGYCGVNPGLLRCSH
jgi:hypothetical protein